MTILLNKRIALPGYWLNIFCYNKALCYEDLIFQAPNICSTLGHCVGLFSWSHSCSGWRQWSQLSTQLCHSFRYHKYQRSPKCKNVLFFYVYICICVHARRRWWPFPDGQKNRGNKTDSEGKSQTHKSSTAPPGHGKTHMLSVSGILERCELFFHTPNVKFSDPYRTPRHIRMMTPGSTLLLQC